MDCDGSLVEIHRTVLFKAHVGGFSNVLSVCVCVLCVCVCVRVKLQAKAVAHCHAHPQVHCVSREKEGETSYLLPILSCGNEQCLVTSAPLRHVLVFGNK